MKIKNRKTTQSERRSQFLRERRKLVSGTKKFVLAVLVKHLSLRKRSFNPLFTILKR